jgi:hypothetical protein
MGSQAWNEANFLFWIKHYRDKVAAFESGEIYVRIRKEHREELAFQDRIIRGLKLDLANARAENGRIVRYWMQVAEDVRTECEKEKALMRKEMEKMRAEKEEAIGQRDEAKKIAQEKREEAYQAKSQAEEVQQKNDALTARIKKDYTNSSKPSSMDPNHKPIYNSRESSGKKPGGQPGHKHHPRRQLSADETREAEMPQEYKDPIRYRLTGNTIRKQMVFLRVSSYVMEYTTPELEDRFTRKKTHAPFPAGYVDDVNYDSSVKAFAFLLNQSCNVAIDRVRTFLSDVSDGKIRISNGMIYNLVKHFSRKTEAERNALFMKHVGSDVLHADFTFARKKGKQTAVMITATEDSVLYQARPKKGDEGVKDTPVEFYNGTLVSDHEPAIIKHGKRRQECMSHIRRYVIASIENEKKMKWNRKLRRWISRAIKHWDTYQKENAIAWHKMSARLMGQFLEIVRLGITEYEYDPPNKYFKDGFNLCKRMKESPEEYVLFLKDPTVPPTNNRDERYARKFKRKAHQMMSFRGDHGDEHVCNALSVLETLKCRKLNLYQEITLRFAQS